MTDTVPAMGRRALRRQRRRRRNRRIAVALAVAALLAVAFAIYLAVDARPTPAAPQAGDGRTQQTLSLQVQGPNGAGVANALLAQDPKAKAAAAVLIPPQVLVTVPGQGSVPYGRVILGASPATSRGALSDLLGVTVDGGWILDLPTLAKLVDALGGVPVGVDVQVVRGGTVVLSPGQQQLSGARAALYLSYLAPGEQEQARLARQKDVLDGIVNVLPRTQAELLKILDGLGKRSQSSVPTSRLADFLLAMATDDEAGQLQYDTLPVVDQDPGGGVVSFRADEPAVRALVDRLLANSVPTGARAGGNRFLVLNGVGTPGLGEAVRKKLVPAGFVFVSARNAPTFGVRATQVLVPDATAASQQLGERVARTLGVPASSVRTQAFGSVADVIVLVGTDFRP